MREVDREISELKAGKGGSVFLGAVTAPAIELAVPAIREIRRIYPRIEITMQVETSNVLARELIATRHDFIIARIPDDLNPRLFEVARHRRREGLPDRAPRPSAEPDGQGGAAGGHRRL